MKRELKRAKWEYDFDQHLLKLRVWHPTGETNGIEPEYVAFDLVLSRTYMFSLMRFMVSVAQKLRIEEGKKLREKMSKAKDKYIHRIGKLKISNKNLRVKK